MTDWYLRDGGRARARCIALAIALLMVVSGCGEEMSQKAKESEPDLTPREQRIQEFKDLDLEPGETLDGIHLMPWIQVFELERSLDDDLITDVEYIYAEKRADQSRIHRLVFHGELVEKLTEHEGLLADDILFGEDFAIIVYEAEVKKDSLVVTAAPVDFGRLFHGDWDFDFDDAVIGDPHDEPEYDGNPMLALTDGTFGIGSAGGSGNVGSAPAGFDVGHFFSNLSTTGDIDLSGEANFRGRISVSVADGYNNATEGFCERGIFRRIVEANRGSVCIQELSLWAELDIDFLLESELKFTDGISAGAKFNFLDSIKSLQWPVFGPISVDVSPFAEIALSSSITQETIYDWADGMQGKTRFGFDYDAARSQELKMFPFHSAEDRTGVGRHDDAGVSRQSGAEADGNVIRENNSLTFRSGVSLGLAITGSNSAVGGKISGMDFYRGMALNFKNVFYDRDTMGDSDCWHWLASHIMGIDWSLTAQMTFGFIDISYRPGFVEILTDWANSWTNVHTPLAASYAVDRRPARGKPSIPLSKFPTKCRGLDMLVPRTTISMVGEADGYTNQSIQEYLFADDPVMSLYEDADLTHAEPLLTTGNSNYRAPIGAIELNRYTNSSEHSIVFQGFDLRHLDRSSKYEGDMNVMYLVLHNRHGSVDDGPMEIDLQVEYAGDSPPPGFPAVYSIGGQTDQSLEVTIEPGDYKVVEIDFQIAE